MRKRNSQPPTASDIYPDLEKMDEPYKNRDVLEVLYWDAAWSMKDIADYFGVTRENIRYHMEKRGIERRSLDEGFRLSQIQAKREDIEKDNNTVSIQKYINGDE
jgi:predicted DNA-binding protein YlxM (UPF0122 family)